MLDETEKKVTIAAGKVTVGSGDTNLTIKGTKPTSGSVTIDENKGIITGADLVISLSGKDYCVNYNGTKATATAMASGAKCPAA